MTQKHISIQNIETAKLKLKELLRFKSEFEKIFEVYDAVSMLLKWLNISSFFLYIGLFVPIFVNFYKMNQLFAAALLCAFIYSTYIVSVDSLIKAVEGSDIVKRLKETNNIQFAAACQRKMMKYKEDAPIALKFIVSEYRLWHLILSAEIRRSFENIKVDCILPLKEYFIEHQQDPQFLKDFIQTTEVTEDDLHFLRTVLTTDYSLEQMFSFKSY